MKINTIDSQLINFFRKTSIPLARFALFVVFFWFGILKVVGLSPASPLVQALFEKTIPFMSFSQFIIIFGLFEVLLGLLFLFPKATRVVIPLLFLHMITTIMPLFLLSGETWSGFLIPTLEGQYIIKNILIIALAMVISGNLHPMHSSGKKGV